MILVSAEIFPQIALLKLPLPRIMHECWDGKGQTKNEGKMNPLKQPSNHQIIKAQGILLGLRE